MELLNTLHNLMGLVFVLGTIISMGLSLMGMHGWRRHRGAQT